MPRAPAWARMARPSAFATSSRDRMSRHVSGVTCDCMSDTRERSARGLGHGCAGWRTPRRGRRSRRSPAGRRCPRRPGADAIPTSSSAGGRRLGVCSPRLDLWLTVREVVKPRAPARTASVASAAMAAMSSAVASSRLAPLSP